MEAISLTDFAQMLRGRARDVALSLVVAGVVAVLSTLLFVRNEPAIYRGELTLLESPQWENVARSLRGLLPSPFESNLADQYEWLLQSDALAEKIASDPQFVALICGRPVTPAAAISDRSCRVARPLRTYETRGRTGTDWLKAQLRHVCRLAALQDMQGVYARRLLVLAPDSAQAEKLVSAIHNQASEILYGSLSDALNSLQSAVKTNIQTARDQALRASLGDIADSIEVAKTLLNQHSDGVLIAANGPFTRRIWPPGIVAIAAALLAAFVGTLACWMLWYSCVVPAIERRKSEADRSLRGLTAGGSPLLADPARAREYPP